MALNIGKEILIDGTGISYSSESPVSIGSTVTGEGGYPVYITQANEPRITIDIGGAVTIPDCEVGVLKATNETGAEICGEATLGLGGSVTISTTAVQPNSIIVVTPSEEPTGIYYTHTISAGTSFIIESTEAGTDAGLKVKWLIVNPV